jgi:hypothetical protein
LNQPPRERRGGRRPKKTSRRPTTAGDGQFTTSRSHAQLVKEAEAKARRNGPPPIDPTWSIVSDPVAARNAAAERPQNRATEAEFRGIDEFLDADRQEKLPAFKKTREWELHEEKKAAADAKASADTRNRAWKLVQEKKAAAAAAEAKAAAEKEAAREKERSAYPRTRA